VGTLRIYRSVLWAAVPTAIFVGWLSISVLPWMNQTKDGILKAQEKAAEFSGAIAGSFNEFRKGDLVFYVESMSEDKSRLQNIFVQNRQHGKLGLITAKEGYQYVDEETGDRFVVLLDGNRYEGQPGRNDFAVGKMEKYGVRVALQPVDETKVSRRSRSTGELMSSKSLRDQAEFQDRLMLPVAVLVFGLLSVPLCRSMPREGVTGQVALAILFYFLFMNLQAISGSWMKDAVTPLWLGRWWVHPVMLGLGGLLLFVRSHQFDKFRRQVVARAPIPRVNLRKAIPPKIVPPQEGGPQADAPRAEELPKVDAPSPEERPRVKRPGFKLPGFKLPKVKLPKLKLPDLKLPREKLSKLKLPEIKPPRVKLPKIDLAKLKLPKVKLPKFKLPRFKLPRIKFPRRPKK
jgi:lipopolysaccharide export system permease protein